MAENRSSNGGSVKEGWALANYVLLLLSPLIVVASGLALMTAVTTKDTVDDYRRSHYLNQIAIIWRGWVFFAVGLGVLYVMWPRYDIGALLTGAAAIWWYARSISGLQTLFRKEPVVNPDRWSW